MLEPIVLWDLEDDADGNYVHIVMEHGVSQDEVWDVVGNRNNPTVPSDSSGRPSTFGWTQTGRHLLVVWEHVEDDPWTHQARHGLRRATAGPAPKEREEKAMTVHHVFHKATRTAEETAKLRADREHYQREKPAPEQLLAEGGHAEFTTLGGLLLLHQLAAWLKQERERQGLTLAQLSKRSGIDQAALSRLETGINANPTLDTVVRAAGALGKVVRCCFEDAPGDVPKRATRGVKERAARKRKRNEVEA